MGRYAAVDNPYDRVVMVLYTTNHRQSIDKRRFFVMAGIRTRKRGKTWSYSFEAGNVNGKRKVIEKGGFASQDDAFDAGVEAYSALEARLHQRRGQKDTAVRFL